MYFGSTNSESYFKDDQPLGDVFELENNTSNSTISYSREHSHTCSSSYNKMSNIYNVNYNNTDVNNLVNSDLFNLILISKHTLIDILYSMQYLNIITMTALDEFEILVIIL